MKYCENKAILHLITDVACVGGDFVRLIAGSSCRRNHVTAGSVRCNVLFEIDLEVFAPGAVRVGLRRARNAFLVTRKTQIRADGVVFRAAAGDALSVLTKVATGFTAPAFIFADETFFVAVTTSFLYPDAQNNLKT